MAIPVWQLIDLALAAYEVGMERKDIVDEIHQMEDDGKSRKQISAWLSEQADQSEEDAQEAIDNA